MSPRNSAADAGQTRAAILDRAVDVASLEGLEGLTIGRLAGDMRMSKAGVVGGFGSKEALQLATLEQAITVWRREVWDRVADVEQGLPRLQALCQSWVAYLDSDVFPGGCFLTAASFEFDGRPGSVHDAIADALDLWRRVLVAEARTAVERGDLPEGTDPDQVAFELNALAVGANQARQLHGAKDVRPRTLAAMERVLAAPPS